MQITEFPQDSVNVSVFWGKYGECRRNFCFTSVLGTPFQFESCLSHDVTDALRYSTLTSLRFGTLKTKLLKRNSSRHKRIELWAKPRHNAISPVRHLQKKYVRLPHAMAQFILKIEKPSHIIGTAPTLQWATKVVETFLENYALRCWSTCSILFAFSVTAVWIPCFDVVSLERRRNTFACCEFASFSVNTETAFPKCKYICIAPSRLITAFRAKNKTIAPCCCYSGVRLKILTD